MSLEEIKEYDALIASLVEEAESVAIEAKKLGEDPLPEVEILFAEDMAERCEKLLHVEGLAERIRALESEGYGREEMSLKLTEEFANGTLGNFETNEERIDKAVRMAVAVLTEGVVAAPIEGIEEVTIETESDGTEFVKVRYAGPIRSAGGTGQALSVLVADYARSLLGIPSFVPRDEEVERAVAEIKVYDSAQSLQYMPKDKEVRKIVRNCHVMLDGAQVDTREVGAYRDLERVDGNRARGGMCLTIAEGVAQKAAKLQKYTAKMGMEDWDWLSELEYGVDMDSLESGDDGDDDSDDDENEPRITELEPVTKYMKDVISGRPVLCQPSTKGGFRLRYGRARNTSLAASGMSPATMALLDDFIAVGTQIKTERPGKAQGVAPVDSIEGPTVKLNDGRVFRVDDEAEAKEILDDVVEILDLGELAVPYGEFLENNHPLAPASYVHEWWIQEAHNAGGPSELDVNRLIPAQAFALSEKFGIPLHPKYTYLWHDITFEQYAELTSSIKETSSTSGDLTLSMDVAATLEALLVPHHQHEEEGTLTVEAEHADVLRRCCDTVKLDNLSVMDAVQEASGITIRKRAPTRIGTRMGRPEKTEDRDLGQSGLVPIGHDADNFRRIYDVVRTSLTRHQEFNDGTRKKKSDRNQEVPRGHVREALPIRWNEDTEEHTWRVVDPETGKRTTQHYYCRKCKMDIYEDEVCPRCGNDGQRWKYQDYPIADEWETALETLGMRAEDASQAKGVKGLISDTKIPEPMEKSLLRSKYELRPFKDGTLRYDINDLPLTAFKPEEVGTSVEKLRELGYSKDMNGDPLERPDQMCELKVQDVVINDKAGDYLLRVAQFVDELLVKYYGLDPYYNAETVDDLIGHLLVGLAPHTSAGTICRFIGTTSVSVGYAHPFFHAAKRRNCFAPSTRVSYLNGKHGYTNTSIKQFFNEHFRPQLAQTDDFGTEYSPVTSDVQVLSVTETGKSVVKNITHVQRTPAPNKMVTITTNSGLSMTVTPDHDVLVWDSSTKSLVRKSAIKVNEDDIFARPTGEISEEMRQQDLSESYAKSVSTPQKYQTKVENSYLDPVQTVSVSRNTEIEYVYNLTVEDTHTLVADGVWVAQCDGDEDSFMLLLDGLVNFSEQYLPHNRTGWSMDAPRVITVKLDPTEIDGEAHNVDIPARYPVEFYEATLKFESPKNVDIEIAEDRIEGDYTGFKHSIETSRIDAGPDVSAYKTIGDMDAKLGGQLKLATLIRAVDEDLIASTVIESHLLADIRGNMRAFAQQGVRCQCGAKYDRVPLTGKCRECGQDKLLLTVYPGMVTKYIPKAIRLSEEYDVDPYFMESVSILENEANSLFEDDTNKQAGLADFM